jgi:hypothetical protein
LRSSFLVHVHVSAPYNSIFLKYTLYVVVYTLCLKEHLLKCGLHFLSMSLFHNMLFIKW